MGNKKTQSVRPYLAQNGKMMGVDETVKTTVDATHGVYCPTCRNMTTVEIEFEKLCDAFGVKKRTTYDALTVMHQCGFEVMLCYRHQIGTANVKILVMPKGDKVYEHMAMAVSGEGVDPDGAFENLMRNLWNVEDPVMKELMSKFMNAKYQPLQTRF